MIKNIFVTGANRGIGFGIVKYLNLNHPSKFNIIVGCRNKHLWDKSVSELQFPEKVNFTEIDLENPLSFVNLTKFLKEKQCQIDMIVNNAGINLHKQNISKELKAEKVISVNFLNQVELVETIINENLLSNDARIINISSTLASLAGIRDTNIKSKLKEVDSIKQLIDLAYQYIEGCQQQKHYFSPNLPWPEYAFSKILLTLYSEFLQKEHDKKGKNTFVCAVCPGWVKTDLGGMTASLTVDQSIETFKFLFEEEEISPDFKGKLISNKQIRNIRS